MLSILLIYFIGKPFYDLSTNYDKNKWVFAILGVVTYYLGTFIGGIVLGLLDVLLNVGFDWDNRLLLGIMAIPFGILTCYGLYVILKKKWQREALYKKNEIDEIDDIGKTNNQD